LYSFIFKSYSSGEENQHRYEQIFDSIIVYDFAVISLCHIISRTRESCQLSQQLYV